MINPAPHISFHFTEALNLRDRRRLKAFLVQLFRQESQPLAEITYVFCDDDYLLNLNRRFLNHDYYTDILSFPSSKSKAEPVLGEIYISVDRVRDNARALSTGFNKELHRVIFHGALHFCHYKDKTKKDRQTMRAREDYYLAKYFG